LVGLRRKKPMFLELLQVKLPSVLNTPLPSLKLSVLVQDPASLGAKRSFQVFVPK